MSNLYTFAERTWLEQGRKVGEHVIPLARNFNDASMDLESGSRNKVCDRKSSPIGFICHLLLRRFIFYLHCVM